MPRKKVPINPEKGKRLKEIIVLSGLSQKKVAEMAHFAPQHLSNIICGKRNLTLEMAQDIKRAAIPSMRFQYVMCLDDFRTEEEKDAYSRAVWEKNQATSAFFDKIFHCFINGIENESGYGFHSQGSNPLVGDYVEVTDNAGAIVGVVPVEALAGLRDELEHYASYLIQLLVKEKMEAVPISSAEKGDD